MDGRAQRVITSYSIHYTKLYDNPPNLERYGILKLAEDNLHVEGIVEKPAPGKAPSTEASIGRYLYTPELFDYLEEGWEKHTGGEYFHTYALGKLMDQGKVVYKETEGERLDTGAPSGYRITSYNVCYTKLLRALRRELPQSGRLQQMHQAFQRHSYTRSYNFV